MFSNTGFVGNNYKWFIGQVPPKKNQYQGNVKWADAWGDRVKVRIPGFHPQDSSLKNDDLPWAMVAKPTSQGNFNGGSTGIMGGEWVIGFFMDESCQIPVITHVLGVNLVGNSIDAKKLQSLDSTFFEPVNKWDGTGHRPGPNATVGGPPPNKSAASDITKDEFDAASTEVARDYTPQDRAEDKMLLRSIQRGELGPVPRQQIDEIINRINGVNTQVRSA